MKSVSHFIADISYSKDWLQCICGWEGKAYDLKAYYFHRKDAPPLENSIDYDKPYGGTFLKRRIQESY